MHFQQLGRVEPALLEQDVVGRAELADIVHRRCGEQGLRVGLGLAKMPRDGGRVVGHALDVPACLRVASLRGTAQAHDQFAFAQDDAFGGAPNFVGQVRGAIAQQVLCVAQLQQVAQAQLDLGGVDRLGEEVRRPDLERLAGEPRFAPWR